MKLKRRVRGKEGEETEKAEGVMRRRYKTEYDIAEQAARDIYE